MKAGKSKKPTGQRHMTRKPDGPHAAKGTMGTGKVEPKAKGTMGKHQSTGDGGASKS